MSHWQNRPELQEYVCGGGDDNSWERIRTTCVRATPKKPIENTFVPRGEHYAHWVQTVLVQYHDLDFGDESAVDNEWFVVQQRAPVSEVVTFGRKNSFHINIKNIEWLHLGLINDDKKLNLLYRAADLMLSPSTGCNGPHMVVEAISNNFVHGPETCKKLHLFLTYFPWWSGGCYLPAVGALAAVHRAAL